jgi:subtilisin family serine protease
VLVGQSDSGVQWDHPELRDSYRGKDGSNQYNWLDPWTGSTSPTDHGGHGTHTLGTIVGKNTGVAPGAEWIGCVNLERNLGNPPYYLNCLQFMLAPYPQDGDPLRDGRPDLGAMVLNNSWGCPNMEGCDAEALKDAVDALKVAGVFVVASAGNDGPVCSSLSDPIAIYHDVFSVGAIDAAGKLAPFSSVGPVTVDGSGRIKPDIVAPGVQILSAFPGNTYQRLEGTSMAGPHVVGVVALMWSANPKLIGNIERTVEILQESAAPYQGDLPSCPEADQIPSSAFGYGIVDAYQAVKLSLQEP